ncbi:MAG: amidohydrolase family protein [Planctomycetes bacterium]|nr:amidohydrolase family protein [Planctomycetota bacterium]
MRALAPMRLLLAAALAAAAAAQDPAAPPSSSFAMRCGTLLTGDGTTVLRDAWLVIENGKVSRIGGDSAPAGLPVVDARGKVVMPGIVAVDSDLAAAADSDYQLTPDALALDSFDFERNWITALQGGVTTAYLSPGRLRLVSGQGAVVKLAGQDLVERVLSDSQSLRVHFGEAALNAPRVFEPSPHPTDEDPLEAARIQTPTGRISVLAELRAAFAAATDKNLAPGGEGPAEHRYDERPLAAVVGGKLPLRAGAFLANDIRRALQLQQELGVRMVLEDPQEIAAVAKQAAEQKVAATFRMPVRPGRQGQGGEDRLDKTPQPRPEAAAKAAAAGMKIGLAPAPGMPLRDYLMAVAVAVRHGLPSSTALRAIGQDAAAILGVDGRVGSLQPGKDADFIVLSGEPLAIGTMVEQTWIDGRRVYARQTTGKALAIRAGVVHDGQGRVYRNGVVLVQDGRIKGVGEDLAIPYGAEVIDLPNGVMTPGLIDAFSHLGLAGDGAPVPNGAPDQRLHEAVAFDDPMFQPALAEGITTVLVAGKDGGLVSGRIAALKTGAADHAGMIVRAIAGQRYVHEAIGPDAIKPLADQIGRGKQYVESWRKYEKELAEWQQGKLVAAAPPPPPPSPDAAPVEDPVSGTWEAEISIQGQLTLKVALELKLEGTKVSGQVKISFGGREAPPQPISSGSFENGTLKLEFRGAGGGGGGSTTLEATLNGDQLTGKITLPRIGDQDVTGTRTQKGSGGGASAKKASREPADEAGKPKAPKVDEGLEPLRAALEKRGALVVRTNRGAAIRDVVELLGKEGIPYVLQGAEDLLDAPELTGGKKPTVMVGPDGVTEDKGQLRNAAAMLADQDLPVLFGSGECLGARNLPLHAAYAVRYGFNPADALRGLTGAAAAAFQLGDRIGSLQKGRDGDLVVFSGDPFEPQSRVLLVVCNGRVVVDRREGKQ